MFTKLHTYCKSACGCSSDKLSGSCCNKKAETSNEPRLSNFLLGFPLTSSRRADVFGHCLTCAALGPGMLSHLSVEWPEGQSESCH